jgi:hypothetical protein
LAWVDGLRNADAATKQWLKVCAASAAANYAAVRRATFDYDLQREVAVADPAGGATFLTQRFRGTVSWRDGAVRYDFAPESAKGEERLSVIRTKDMLAAPERNPVYGFFLVVDFPPASLSDWRFQHPALLTRLDPWVHYASNFRAAKPSLREFWEGCRTIEAEEAEGVVRLRFARADTNGRVDIYCDKAADYLPVRTLGGENRGKEFVVFTERSSEWGKTDGVWYPRRHVEVTYYGAERRPLRDYDLTIRNLRVNEAAVVPDSAFAVSTMALPEKTFGIDRRRNPPTQLIRLGGVVQERRGQKVELSAELRKRMEQEQATVAARLNRDAEETIRGRARWTTTTWVLLGLAGMVGLSLVVRRLYLIRTARSV